MIPHTLLLQPRTNTPSWPTDPTPPIAADAGTGAAPAPAPVGSQNVTITNTTDNSGNTSVTVSTSYLNQEMCETANRNGLIAAGGYTFGASLLGVIIFMVMRKKLWGSAFTRYVVAILTAALLSSILVAWDPVRADVLERCMDPNQGFAQYVFLGSMLAARALVLGLVPSVIVTFLGCFAANRT